MGRDIDSKGLGIVGSEERVVGGVWKRSSVGDQREYNGYNI